MNFPDLAKRVPRFADQFLGLINGPKRYLASLDLAAPDALADALLFFALALIVDAILGIPFAGEGADFWRDTAVAVVFQVLGLFAMSVLLFIAWRLLGGRAPLRHHLIYTLYLWGISVLILSFSNIAAKGVMMVRRPDWFELYREYMTYLLVGSPEIEAEKFAALAESDALFLAMLVLLAGHLLMLAWFATGWGAYRVLNDSTRNRSALALLIFLVLAYPLNYLLMAGQHAAGIPVF